MLVATVLGVFLIPGNFAFVEDWAANGPPARRVPRRQRPGRGALMEARDPMTRRAETRRSLVAVGVVALGLSLLSACAIGPNYKRPTIESPPTYRGGETPVDARSLADLPWWEVFHDPVLKGSSMSRSPIATTCAS